MGNRDTTHYRARLFIFILLLILIAIICAIGSKECECEASEMVVVEAIPISPQDIRMDTKPVEETVVAVEVEEPEQEEENLDEYYLAKIAMAEAEGESLEGKVLVVEVVLNRVADRTFPDTIYEVITEESHGTYQFSPVIPGGRWYTTEPNDECYEAVKIALEGRTNATDALYFTSSKEESTWHSRNLTYLFEHGNHKFYK